MVSEGRPIGERAAILETKVDEMETEYQLIKDELKEIREKLDDLLHLKSKGMGAFYFVSLLVGSGLLGLVATIFQFFNNRPHL